MFLIWFVVRLNWYYRSSAVEGVLNKLTARHQKGRRSVSLFKNEQRGMLRWERQSILIEDARTGVWQYEVIAGTADRITVLRTVSIVEKIHEL